MLTLKGTFLATIKVDFDPQLYLDPIGYANAKHIKADMRKDKSATIVVVGKERRGKTTFADIFGAVIDPDLDTAHVVFPTAELRAAVNKEREHCYRVILQDEGAETWLSDEAAGADAKEMVRMFMETGYKNLCVIILIPDYAKVQRYLKAHRVDVLIRIVKRGTYHFYSESRAKAIKINHDTKQIMWGKPNFAGWYRPFPKTAFWEEVERKKRFHLGSKDDDPRVIAAKIKIMKLMKKTVNSRMAAAMMGLRPTQFQHSIARGSLSKYGVKPVKFGNAKRWFITDITRLVKLHIGGNIDMILREEQGD